MSADSFDLDALFRAQGRRLYRLARRLSPDAAAAEDLVQETFLRATRHARLARPGPERAEAWLVRTLVNLARDRFRRERVRREALPRVDLSAAAPADPERAAVARRSVAAALAGLPPRRRAVVVLHELEERETAEIAGLLGISRATVRWHLAAGRRQLAELIDENPAREENR